MLKSMGDAKIRAPTSFKPLDQFGCHFRYIIISDKPLPTSTSTIRTYISLILRSKLFAIDFRS